MARSNHGVLTAAERFERGRGRNGRPTAFGPRQNSRHAARAAAISEQVAR